jgi:cytochrome c oxidase subunit II
MHKIRVQEEPGEFMKHSVSALRAFVVAATALVAGNVHAADGKTLYVTCMACHGAGGEGNRQLGAPNIAGKEAWYLERQLNAFADGSRGGADGDGYGAQMRVAVANLPTPADRKAVAVYIAGLPRVAQPAPTAKAKADLARGATHFNAVCSSCHGASGKGNPNMQVPGVVGLDPVYLARQFAAYRNGTRGYSKDDKLGRQMRAAAGMLDAKADADVLAYIATLKP